MKKNLLLLASILAITYSTQATNRPQLIVNTNTPNLYASTTTDHSTPLSSLGTESAPIVDSFRFTSLMVAASQGNLELVKNILNNTQIDINDQDRRGNTALHYAAYSKINDTPSSPVVEYLLDHGALRNQINNTGNTPLMLSAQRGLRHIFMSLVTHADNNRSFSHTGLNQYEANINHQNHKGETALYLASKNSHKDIVEELLMFKADPSLTTYSGETPLSASIESVKRFATQNK